MKILFLSSDHADNPWFGGGEAYQINRLCSGLKENHEIEVVTPGWPGGPVRSTVNGVQYRHGYRLPGKLCSRLGYCLRSLERVSQGSYDILVETISAFSPTFAPCVSRKPAIADFRLDPFEALEKHPRAAPLLRARLKHNLRHFQGGIALSSSLASNIRKRCPFFPAIKVIPPGIDISRFECQEGHENYILYLGRIDIDHKGLNHLVEAFARVKKDFPDIRLVIGGTGPDERELKKLIHRAGIEQWVDFPGWVEGEKKVRLLQNCILVCMPSRREGWGQVALEAAACGKPVVGYDITGLKDAVINGRTGLLVEPRDVNSLAQAVRKLIQDSELRGRYGKAARGGAEKLTWQRTARLYDKACKELERKSCE
ncbi:MAG: glycosyltransferase family 4 protein [Candidatus Brocadiia bacterium]